MFKSFVAATTAVGALAVAVTPAAAEAPFVGPNCEGMLVSTYVAGVGAKEAAENLGLSVHEAHEFVQSLCAGVNTTPPRCEVGHSEAAERALARGDLDAYLSHLGALFRCFLGESPGGPL